MEELYAAASLFDFVYKPTVRVGEQYTFGLKFHYFHPMLSWLNSELWPKRLHDIDHMELSHF